MCVVSFHCHLKTDKLKVYKMPTKTTTEIFTVPGHCCEIVVDSQSCLPKVPPQAGCPSRFTRWARKKLMVSRRNPRTLMFFRSEAATKAEKRRQLRAPWFIIHPFSQCSMYREMIMCFIWIIMYILEPIMMAFFTEIDERNVKITVLLGAIDVCLAVNVFMCFILGYHVSKTKEVVLSPTRIISHYLRTYFIVDVMAAVPSGSVSSRVFKVHDTTILTITTVFQIIGFCRLGTMLLYFRQLTLQFNISDTLHEFLCLVLMTIFILHWLACSVYLLPAVNYFLTGSVDNSSWTYEANVVPNATTNHLWQIYGESYFIALSYFLSAGYGEVSVQAYEEQILFSIIYIIGMAYIGYMIVVIFEIFSCTHASESKYEEIIHQLNEYMRNKQLPHELRTRLLLHYKNRFHMRYFRETVILSALSEQQRSELFLYSCRELIQSAKLFHGIPKTFVGSLMGSLKNEVYLTNDVILRAGSRAECMFFIDKGTVAEVLATGKEVRHLEDGEHFGEMPLVLKEAQGKRIVNYIAVEVTECYLLEKKDLMYCMAIHEEFGERLRKHASERYELLLQMEDDEDFIINRNDLLYELRSGKILEQPRRRLPYEQK